MRWAALAICAAAVLAGASGSARAEPGLELTATLRAGFPVNDYHFTDVTGDGAEEILVTADSGEVLVFKLVEGKLRRTGSFLLEDPKHSILWVANVTGVGDRPQLVALDRSGMTIRPFTAEGGFEPEGMHLRRTARFSLRVGRPRFVEFARDLNADGKPEILVPGPETYDILINRGAGKKGAPRFRRAARVHAELRHTRTTEGWVLSEELDTSFRIPPLTFEDVNGDGRPDLVVEDDRSRAFHLQREDGTLPRSPDIVLDLTIFRDTTASAEIRPGKVLAGTNKAQLSMTDLDKDGIPDYVIAHRRKIWVFHGSKAGPDFHEPSAILKVPEDVTVLLVANLDDDGYPDLLLVRVQVPTVATILKGLFAEIDVEISAAGYSSEKGKTFSKTPTHRGELQIRLPEIVGIARNPEALLRRFEETASKFRTSVNGDFDGDGTEDVALVTPDGTALEMWRVRREIAETEDAVLRKVFFEDTDRVWSLDRIIDFIGSLGEQHAATLTGGRDPDAKLDLRAPYEFDRLAVRPADLDGDGRDEMVAVYRDLRKKGEGVLDVIRLK